MQNASSSNPAAPTNGAITQSIYYVTNIKGGANTVTVTFNQSAASPDVRVLEYSGLSTSSPLDVVAAASGSSTAASSGSATTSSANELVFGADTVYTTTKSAGTGFTSRIISPDGDIAEDENVSSAGSYSAAATLNSSGNWVMQMATFKAAANAGTSVYADVAYAPYGESYAPSGASDLSFTGQNNDTVSNLYDFLLREYHPVQGRWISPDPAGVAAVNPMNPQTWNRYAYVGGNPLIATDPSGLGQCSRLSPTGPGCDGGGIPDSNSGGGDSMLDEFDLMNIPVYSWDFGVVSSTLVDAGNIPVVDKEMFVSTLVYGYGWQLAGDASFLIAIGDVPSGGAANNGTPQTPQPPQPQSPTPQQPQKKPCTPLQNNLSGQAKGVDTLADAFSRFTHPLDMLAVNATMFFAAGGQIAGGGLLVSAGCLEPTPFEPLTCLGGGALGSTLIASGTASGAFGVYFFKNYTLPAIKDWGCHE